MNLNKLLFQYSIFFMVFCCIGCKCNKQKKSVHLTKQNLQIGAKYYFSSITQSNTQFIVNDKNNETKNYTEAAFIFEQLSDSAGIKKLKITYDKYKAIINKDGKIQEIDISNSSSILDKLLGKIKGASLIVYVNNKSKVLSVSGYKEIMDTVLNSLQINDISAKQKVQQQIDNIFGEEFVKNIFEQSFRLLPDTSVTIGYKWQKESVLKDQINLNLVNNFELEDIENNVAFLSNKADISPVNNVTSFMYKNAITNLVGKLKGNYQIDIATGLTIEGKTTTSLKGNIQILNSEIPLTIETSTIVRSKKL